MNGRTFAYPRGRLLGGSSSASKFQSQCEKDFIVLNQSLDYLFHQYGTNEDWNRLGSTSGDSGWSWSNMKKYIQKVPSLTTCVNFSNLMTTFLQHEKFVPPVDGHNTTGQFIPSLHGFNGVTSVSLPGNNQTIDPRVIATTQQLAEFPYNQDMSGGDQPLLGIGWLQSSAGGGVRSSSSTSYLAQTNSRPNLKVVINTTAMKLVQTGVTASALKSFRAVLITSSPGASNTPSGKYSKLLIGTL